MKEQEFIKYCLQLNQLICDAMDQFISGCNIEEISEEDVSGVIQAVLSNNHLSHFACFYIDDMVDIENYGDYLKNELKRLHLIDEGVVFGEEIVGRA